MDNFNTSPSPLWSPGQLRCLLWSGALSPVPDSLVLTGGRIVTRIVRVHIPALKLVHFLHLFLSSTRRCDRQKPRLC